MGYYGDEASAPATDRNIKDYDPSYLPAIVRYIIDAVEYGDEMCEFTDRGKDRKKRILKYAAEKAHLLLQELTTGGF